MKRAFLLMGAIASVFFAVLGISIRANAEASIIITENFDFIRQGTVGIITLTGSDLAGAVATTLDHTYHFYQNSKGFAALIAVPIQQKIKTYPIQITITKKDGSSANWNGSIKVESGEFVNEPAFILPSNKIYLLNMVIQTVEDARLEKIYSMYTPTRMWDSTFTRPINGTLSSPFGSWRTYNDGTTRRHTGYDFSSSIGTPVQASSNGRVVFAQALDIHGNSVIIDHGLGIFTEYSHLSEIYVVPGQIVSQGDIVGLSGNTGRSTGPHVHWEVAVNGVWVNPLTFQTLKLPL